MKLKFSNLDFTYGESRVLFSVSGAMDAGGLTCVLGENGSGKSTLLKCLCGILTPATGKVIINGIPLKDLNLKQRARLVAYTPQYIQTDNSEVVFDFILQGRKPWFLWQEGEEDKTAVFDVLEKLNISKLTFRRLGELSGGERQKVILARTLVQGTDVIILDEPTNNLDLSFQIELFGFLRREVDENGKLIVIAVHDVNMALRYGTDAILLKKGCITHSGDIYKTVTEKSIEETLNIKNRIIDVENHRVMVPLH